MPRIKEKSRLRQSRFHAIGTGPFFRNDSQWFRAGEEQQSVNLPSSSLVDAGSGRAALLASPHLIELFMNGAPGCARIRLVGPELSHRWRTWLTPRRAYAKSGEKCVLVQCDESLARNYRLGFSVGEREVDERKHASDGEQ